MHDLESTFISLIAHGLERNAINRCSVWAEKYREIPHQITKESKPWSFDLVPWSKEMHDASALFLVGKKAAQMAYSETVLNRTFYKIDVERVNCLYVLPNKTPDASDFSTTRFDVALDLSDHLKQLFSDTKNVGLKRAGSRSLWIRGGRSPSGLKSIDPSFIVLDEYDEMSERAIELALRRGDGQWSCETWAISTPTVPERGIDRLFSSTTQERWVFKCPVCSQYTELLFPDCLKIAGDSIFDTRVRQTHVVCNECKKPIKHEEKVEAQQKTGKWISTKQSEARGFYINQLYSCVKEPWRLVDTALKAEVSEASEQEWWNSCGGLAHVVKGGRLEEYEVEACIRDYVMDPRRSNQYKLVTMGVDVQGMSNGLYYEVAGWSIPKFGPDLNLVAQCHVLCAGVVDTFRELSQIVRQYRVRYIVSDWQPDERAVYEFCAQHWGFAKRCQYTRGQGGKRLTVVQPDEELKVAVDRTWWLDLSLGRIRSRQLFMPKNVPMKYRQQLRNLVKHFREEEVVIGSKKQKVAGRMRSDYIQTGEDHFAHARNYNEIALPLAASLATNQSIRSFL